MTRIARMSTLSATGLSLAAAIVAQPALAANANENLGFPLTAAAMAAPNGAADDAGWNDAFERPLEDGSPVHLSVMKGVATASAVYLYVETENSAFRKSDALVVAFNAGGTYRKLIVRPCDTIPGGTCTNDTSAVLSPKVSSTSGTLAVIDAGSGAYGAAPAGVVVASRSAGAGATVRWGVEIRLDRAALGIPANGRFPLYVNAIATDPGSFGVPASATNFSWPVNSPIFANGPGQLLENVATREPRWGQATLDPALMPAGIQIMGFSNVGLDPSKISLSDTQANKFAATIANAPTGGAVPPPASNVSVRFQINNIGLNPTWTWTDVPTTGNPTAAKAIQPRQYQTFQADPWTVRRSGTYLSSGKTEFQFFTDNLHQCVRVLVRQGATILADRFYNMNFVTVNSPFSGPKQIATGAWREGFPKARAVILSERFRNAPADLTWESSFGGARALGGHRWMIDDLSQGSRLIDTKVLVSDRLRLPVKDYTLDTARLAAGDAVKVAVTPGTPVTILAEGEAKLGEQAIAPDGLGTPLRARFDPRLRGRAPIAARSALEPGREIGTGQLIGSFDNFRTSFPLGSATTVVAPAGVNTMQVRMAGGATGASGTWRMQAMTGVAEGLRVGNAIRDRFGRGKVLPLAENLPAHIVHGSLDTGETIMIDGQAFNVMVPMGSYGSYIYRVNIGPLTPVLLDPDIRIRDRIGPVIRPDILRPDVVRPDVVRPGTVVPARPAIPGGGPS